MRQLALNVILDVTFGIGTEGAAQFENTELLLTTIVAYLKNIAALAKKIPPLW